MYRPGPGDGRRSFDPCEPQGTKSRYLEPRRGGLRVQLSGEVVGSELSDEAQLGQVV